MAKKYITFTKKEVQDNINRLIDGEAIFVLNLRDAKQIQDRLWRLGLAIAIRDEGDEGFCMFQI